MSIYLIRHGETPGNANRVIQVAETPLSDRGLQQAEALATRLADAGVVHILASDLSRAHMTAQALERTTGAPLELEPLLQERNLGDLRGTPYSELGFDPFAPDYVPPAGESWDAFHDRVARAWRRVADVAPRLDGHLAVVTHGLVCRAVVQHHVTLRGSAASDPEATGAAFGNTCLSVIESQAPFGVELLACTAHLGGSAPEGAPV